MSTCFLNSGGAIQSPFPKQTEQHVPEPRQFVEALVGRNVTLSPYQSKADRKVSKSFHNHLRYIRLIWMQSDRAAKYRYTSLRPFGSGWLSLTLCWLLLWLLLRTKNQSSSIPSLSTSSLPETQTAYRRKAAAALTIQSIRHPRVSPSVNFAATNTAYQVPTPWWSRHTRWMRVSTRMEATTHRMGMALVWVWRTTPTWRSRCHRILETAG